MKIRKSKIDNANLENLKNASSKDQRGNLYNHASFQDLKGKSDKEKRGFIRRKLESFRSNILGIDRKEEERKTALIEFLSFYKKFWRIQDFKFESFSNQKDTDFQKDFNKILSLGKLHLEGKKAKRGTKKIKDAIKKDAIIEDAKIG